MLISRHAPSILRMTTQMLGQSSDAEDVAQETFIAAYKALGRFQFGAKFSTWLYRIAINKCHDSLRGRRTDTVPLDENEESEMARVIASGETPQLEWERVELAAELRQGIHALPPLYREAFVLRHVEGVSYDEMSAILGVHRDTLKMRVYKARTLLCRALAHLNGVYR